jgi:hypothetical protein
MSHEYPPAINGIRGAGLAVGKDVGQGGSPKELDPVDTSPRLGLEEIKAPICLDRDANNLETLLGSETSNPTHWHAKDEIHTYVGKGEANGPANTEDDGDPGDDLEAVGDGKYLFVKEQDAELG